MQSRVLEKPKQVTKCRVAQERDNHNNHVWVCVTVTRCC